MKLAAILFFMQMKELEGTLNKSFELHVFGNKNVKIYVKKVHLQMKVSHMQKLITALNCEINGFGCHFVFYPNLKVKTSYIL